jgi:hypothetical protein
MQAKVPGPHSAYLHVLSDPRGSTLSERWMGVGSGEHDDDPAIREIDAAIND